MLSKNKVAAVLEFIFKHFLLHVRNDSGPRFPMCGQVVWRKVGIVEGEIGDSYAFSHLLNLLVTEVARYKSQRTQSNPARSIYCPR